MKDIAFWGMVFGLAVTACFFLLVVLRIIERKKNWLVCGTCQWEGEIPDQFDCCPNCGHYNWSYNIGDDE